MPRFLLLWIPVVVLACFAFTGESAEAEEGLASWYGPGFSGLPTASGDLYDPYGFTAAHKTMPLGTELLVAYGGNSVEVTVNDRGPYVGDRELDLSQGAAQAIGLTEAGVDVVQYAAADPYVAPVDDASMQQTNTQYASTTQYESGSVSTSQDSTQYAASSEPVASEQYAVSEAPVEELAAPVVTESVSVPAPDYYPPGSGTSIDASSILVVRPGETLSEIALEMGVSLDYLAAQNKVSDPNFIQAGQVLYY